jgi:S1-C subfamily serine protease
VRAANGEYRIRDVASTNGTFLNGRRIAGEEMLNDGDVIWLGAEGPHVQVHLLDRAASQDKSVLPATAVRPSGQRPSTGERVRVAVRHETAWMRRVLMGSLVVLVGGVGAAYWAGHRSSQMQVDDLLNMLAESESTSARIEARLSSAGDTTFASMLRQQNAALAARIRSNGATATPEQLTALRQEIAQQQVVQQGLALLDLSTISARNDPAIAFLVTELDGKPYGGTAFGITTDGMLVTNRHNVQSPVSGRPATRLGIKYANTDVLLHAHVVSVATDHDVDLALVKVDEPGTYPVVAGIARSSGDVHVGSPVVTIGFPHALDTPMDGNTVKTSLTAGTVSKVLPGFVQLDAYAGHGSSGSPVFDARGLVIGVIYGGEASSEGRITYAVSSDRLIGMVPVGVLRP